MAAVRRRLLVEGDTDKRVIPYLMERNGVEWPKDVPVKIEASGGINNILAPRVIEVELFEPGLEALGVIVDADDDAADRWRAIRDRCRSEFDDLPTDIPAGGLITLHEATGVRFGVWIMPDNQYRGMLEDFLIRLMPAESGALLELARECVAHASNSGAPFKEAHRTKAEIHTWLAWQDEPGKQLHEAVHHRVLDPQRPESQPFVKWFRALFDV